MGPRHRIYLAAWSLSALVTGGCSSLSVPLPNANVALAGVAIYLIVDPMAPNWRIEEANLGEGQYRLSMRLKRFAGGGTGEARQVFQRRAAKLAAEGGYAGYQILGFTESIDSTFPGAERVAEGTIALVGGRS